MLCNRWNIVYTERSILWEATWCGMLYYFSIFFKCVFKMIGQMYKLKAKLVNKTNWMGIMFPWVYGIIRFHMCNDFLLVGLCIELVIVTKQHYLFFH
jgi:hypothetical protein